MTPPQPDKDFLLLGEFLSYLRQREFTIGVDHYLRVQQLIERVDGKLAPDDLKTLLCPLVATSKTEQEHFYAAFDSYFGLRQPAPPPPPSRARPEAEKSRGRSLRLIPLATLILILSTLMLPPQLKRVTTRDQQEIDGPMDTRKIDSIAVLHFTDQSNQPDLNERLLGDLINYLSEHPELKVTSHNEVAQYRGQQVDPEKVGRTLDVRGILRGELSEQGDDLIINAELVNVADGFQLWSESYPYKLAEVRELLGRIALDISNKVWETIGINERPKPPPPVLPGPAPDQIGQTGGTPRQILPPLPPSFWQRHAIAVRTSITLAPLVLFLIYEAVRSMRRRRILHERHGKTPPLTWPLQPQLPHLRVYDSEQFYEAARSMRRRQAGDFYRLDVAATITATIRTAGYPAFRYKSDSKLPEYLVLINRSSPRDHQAGLHAEMVKALEADGIFLVRFFYDRDPRICFNEKGESARLDDLHDRYPGHRLLVFGDGEGLLDPITGQPAKWSEMFLSWEHRALLTPESPALWGFREFILADRFVVLPASIDGLLALADSFATTVPPDLRVWLKKASKAPPGALDGVDALDTLRGYLGDEVFQWLCACAVYPELHWSLTLYLGSLPEVGKNLLKAENLTRLVRLPWFGSGSIPDQLRVALIKRLAPEAEARVRLVLIGLLENGPRPPNKSFAADAQNLQLAVQRWLYRKDRKSRRELLRVLKAVPQGIVFRDRALLGLLESGRSRAGTLLHRRLLKPFYKAFIPEFGLKTSARVMIAVAAMIVAFASTSGMMPPHTPEDAEPDQQVAQRSANTDSSNSNTGQTGSTDGNIDNSNIIPGNGNVDRPGTVTLMLGAYTTPREAYGKEIIPAFQKYWKDKTGQTVDIQASYVGSGAQSRAIIGGFEADIAALSLEGDIDKIAEAGLITHDWKAAPNRGIVSTSIVVIVYREGNPRAIRDWADLARPGLNVFTPDPKTSGGARWNINAMYGAALRGYAGVAKDNPAAAQEFLKSVFRNVSIMDKGARESITNFEKGVGDVAVTYENEVIVGRQAGQTYDYIIPRSTILIENPVALIDKNVDKHGVREVAEGFINFLFSQEAQRGYARYGLRPLDQSVAEEVKAQYKPVEDLWRVGYLGGWKKVTAEIYGPQGFYTRLIEEVQRSR